MAHWTPRFRKVGLIRTCCAIPSKLENGLRILLLQGLFQSNFEATIGITSLPDGEVQL